MEADKLIELRGLHEPPATIGTLLADGLVALAIGLLIAWAIVQAIKLSSTREVSPEKQALRRLAELKRIEGADGLASRAALLLELGKALPDGEGEILNRVDRHLDGFLTKGAGKGLRGALYRPGAVVDLEQFDRALTSSLHRVAR